MTQTQFAPPETDRTDIGLVFEDQRTGAIGKVVYADDRVVLARDESGHTTMTPRDVFAGELGSRYRPRPGADPEVDGGPFDRIRRNLAEYDRSDGRKASHKADALREALELADGAASARGDDAGADRSPEVPYEDVDGVGPETAANLRTAGYATEADVETASDEAIFAVAGVGPSTLTAIRDALDD